MQTPEDTARARLAFITAGRPPLGAPRRAADEPSAPVAAPSPAPGSGPDPPRRRLTLAHAAVVALLLLCAVGVAVVALGSSAATEIPLEPAPVAAGPSSAHPVQTAAPTAAPSLRVHVAGAVASPGVVTLPAGSIVQDAIEAAGGLTPAAVPGGLNLAAPLTDGAQVVIGTAEQPGGQLSAPPGGGASAGGQVDLNAATVAELEALPGVGPVTAAAIVAWRETNGRFTVVEDLQEVDGIGPKTFERLAPLVRV